ncbi:hypothetical protein UPYG_G00127280 [Umbra pygmaea]|uniref:Gametogenetin-binding protein 2 n=1 Tax=Umbra pygmaea TaxID=75934 RepID=A0ABD0XVV3_UMBPY
MISQRELKEEFVSNLNGTSLGEVALGSFLAPLCLVSKGLFLVLYHIGKGVLPLPCVAHLFLDFSMIILPLVLSCTVLSDILHMVILALAVVAGAVVFYICRTKSPTAGVLSRNTAAKSFFLSHVQYDQVPFVTVFRVLVNVKTAISILAVDFKVFPRRYAKTETYGTGVMDFGVGAYVLANALVCPEARRKEISGSKLNYVVKQLVSVWPLFVLGLARLVSVKMSGYHEHVSEYGVHWNFFFTLAIVRVVASMLLALFPVHRAWLLALLIGGLYQVTLEMFGLKHSIIHNNDRTGGFLRANMEGVSSVVGYIAIYMAGVQIGLLYQDSAATSVTVALVCFCLNKSTVKKLDLQLTTRQKLENMARLVAICRDGEDDYPFLARQIPLYIDDSLTMVMEFTESVMNHNSHQINSSKMKQFVERHSMLKQQDLNIAMVVPSREVFSALSQLVPCVGCRRGAERLFSQLVESGNPALEPLIVKPNGMLSVAKSCVADARKLYTLFYVHGSKLNDIVDGIPKSRKNKRCQLHSLDTHKPKPLGGSWMDVWELMSQDCRDEVVLIDSACLLETLETYLRKHRFCTDCKNKVLTAYSILVGELDCTKEKGYCAALYEGLRCCPHEHHVHVCCETDFIAHLLGRAEPEFAGGYERRERHAKTIDIAQEEVLTCLGIHLYERLHRIWQKLRAEEQTWQMLFYLGIDALRKSFEMEVEKVQGISRLEQLCEELSEEERVKELKQEKKRQKKKNRRKNKCGLDVSEQESAGKDQSLGQGSLESVEAGGCQSCGIPEEGHAGCVEVVITSNESTCSCPVSTVPILGSPKVTKGLAAHSNGSDCGYSSSMEGSEPGSQEGSDVACTEGICNHDEAGDEPCGHQHCAQEDAGDSCVECWANSEENTKSRNKKKKRKTKELLCNDQGPKAQCCCGMVGKRRGQNSSTTQVCRTKDACAKVCCNTFSSMALQLPWAHQGKDMSLYLEGHCCQEDTSAKSLMELLGDSEVTSDDENCLTQDEIRSFVERNKSFYSNRDQYRQHLKDKFTKYCRGGGRWFTATTASVN